MKKAGAKKSRCLSIKTGEMENSCLRSISDQRECKSSENQEYLGRRDEERNMMEGTLIWSLRVLEMVASGRGENSETNYEL